MKTKIIAQRTTEGQYEIPCQQVIVDHQKYGRLLLVEGFGGGDIEGMTYRWRHGLAVQLRDNDTFATLDAPRNDWCKTMGAVLEGQDDSRPVLTWDGVVISAMAKSLGLK